jgi:hypothetical protein
MVVDNGLLYRRTRIEGNVLGDEIVFFDDRAGKYFAVSSVGADIWNMLESPMSMDSIVARLMERYDIDEATCRTETTDFLTRMLAAQLLDAA